MSAEEHKAIVRRFRDERWLAGRLEVADEVLAEAVTRNGEALGREGMKRFIATVRAALPDYRSEAEALLAEGDQVAWQYTSRGTHTGAPFLGVAPTGQVLTIAGTAILRLAGGRIVGIQDRADLLPVYQQLALVTPSGPVARQTRAATPRRRAPTPTRPSRSSRAARPPAGSGSSRSGSGARSRG